MTHETERTFETRIVDWFEDHYGAEHVHRQVWQAQAQWYVDVVVETPPLTIFAELENDADSIRPGTGQALAYASFNEHGVPLVAIPADHSHPERVHRMRRGSRVIIREFDEAQETWV